MKKQFNSNQEDVMELKIIKSITIRIANDWRDRIPIVLQEENIPGRAQISCYYDVVPNETVIMASYREIKTFDDAYTEQKSKINNLYGIKEGE